MTTLDANDEKINQLMNSADKLSEEEHYASDKVIGPPAAVRLRPAAASLCTEFSKSSCSITCMIALTFQVMKRAGDIDDRRNSIRERAMQQKGRLHDTLEIQQFLADCDDVEEWLDEKMTAAQDETYRYNTLPSSSLPISLHHHFSPPPFLFLCLLPSLPLSLPLFLSPHLFPSLSFPLSPVL